MTADQTPGRAPDEPRAAPRLGYSNPGVFFAGARRYRSAAGAAGIVVGAAFAGACAVIAMRIMGPGGAGLPLHARWPWAGSIGLVAALVAALTVYAAWGWAAGLEVPVRVTEEGIENGRRVWRWQQVSGFGGTVAGPRRVQLDFIPGRGALRFPRSLWTTPSLSEAEYAELVERLIPFLATHHPHVRVDQTPRPPE
jgi:hypothetical protein